MQKHHGYKVPLIGSLMALMFLMLGTTCAAGDPVLNAKIEEEISKVRSEQSLTARFHAAERLTDLTFKINPKRVDDKTVADLVSLLDVPEDAVRAQVAAALGHLGRRAKVAIPKLLALLPEADCAQGDLTSATFIRTALEKMGVKPPPPNPAGCK